MTRRRRVVLFLIGLLLIGIAVAALLYALPPTEMIQEQATLAPTLFVPPQGVP